MTILHLARTAARRFGIEVRRWPDGEAGLARVRLLQHQGIDRVLDVGANDGGYASQIRSFGYAGDIVSFEPLTAPRMRLASRRPDRRWTVEPYGLADFDGEVDINVAGNSELSSSILPMLGSHSDAAPESKYVAVERCVVKRLDSIWYQHAGSRVFLKIDVQGFEKAVLKGADDALDQVLGVQIELSFVPLYAGGMLWDEALGLLTSRGLAIARIDPGFADPRTGQAFQADAILTRT